MPSSKITSPDVERAANVFARRADGLIAHLGRILSTPAGTDKTLQTLQYTLIVLHSQLSHIQEQRYRRFLVSIARKASVALLPGETVVATISTPDSRLGNVVAGSKALSALISDFRIFTRLWGLIGVYQWAKSTYEAPPEDKIIRATVWAQVLAGVGFQWYENVAYLAMKGVLRGERFNAQRQAQWWEWSSRFWMAHVALEIVRLMRVWQLSASSEGAAADRADTQNAQALQDKRAWMRNLCVNVAWAPVTAHYSWTQGCLSNDWLGLFGMFAAGTGFRELWRHTS
ncbi:hypothetical protein MBLNU459_g3328t1 [Dothideomycetes sp. NU459]